MSDTNMCKISIKETVGFFVILFVSKILFSNINRYVSNSGNAAYMQTAWCTLIAFLLFSITCKLAGEGDLLSASYKVFGSFGEKTVGFLISLLLLYNAGVMMRVYADIIGSIVLPDSPDFLIVAFLVIASAVAVFVGVGTVVSFSYVAGIVLVASLALILALNIPNYDITNIYPIMGRGADKVIMGVDGISIYADVFLIYLITPYLKNKKLLQKTGTRAILISGIIITVATFLYILTIQYPSSKDFSLPILEIAFDVNLDIIFQRAEGLFLFLWILSAFVVIGTYLCVAVHTFYKSFRLSDRRAVGGMFVFITACIALVFQNSVQYGRIYDVFYKIFTVITFILPILIFGLKRVRER